METKGFFDEWDEVPASTTPATETPATETPGDLTPGEADDIFEAFTETPAAEGDVPPAFVEPDPAPAPAPGLGFIPDSQAVTVDTDVDLVFVIDATGSMGPFLDKVKSTATTFRDTLEQHLAEKKRKVRNVRARVIAFRDYYCDEEPMRDSNRFFDLNDDADKQSFTNFINSIEPVGGGDEPESALEALYLAINSPWSTVPAKKRRQIIVLITDASAHSLEDLRRYELSAGNSSGYPAQMAANLAELQGCWMDGQVINQNAKRLALYTPNSAPWAEIGSWNQTTGTPSLTTLGGGDEVEMSLIFNFIANSI